MRRAIQKLGVVLILLALCGQARAKLILDQFEGVRPLGMGNAFIALADDQNALFYNPAGLALIPGSHGTLIDFIAGVDNPLNSINLANTVAGGDLSSLITNTKQMIRLGTFPTFITRFFGFGIFAHNQSFIEINGLNSPDVVLISRTDVGAVMGAGFPLGKVGAIGVSVKGFVRAGIDSQLTPGELLTQLGVNQSQFEANISTLVEGLAGVGRATSFNAGIILKVPVGKNPEWRLAGAVEDFGVTTFTPFNSVTTPPRIEQTYTLGTALLFPLSQRKKNRRLVFTLDARRAFTPLPSFKQFHFGIELRVPGWSVRGGYHQGDWTFGVTFEALPHTRFSYVTHSKELSNTFRTRIRRWHHIQLSIGFLPI